jgi:hypothetical protein
MKRNQSVGFISDTEFIRDLGPAGPMEMLVQGVDHQIADQVDTVESNSFPQKVGASALLLLRNQEKRQQWNR